MFFVKCSITEARFSLGWDFSFVLLFWLFDLTWWTKKKIYYGGRKKGRERDHGVGNFKGSIVVL